MITPEQIDAKLREIFAPTELQVHDDSEQHRGHSGWQPGGSTHIRVLIVSEMFNGLGRVERQRRVYETLAPELAERVHALQLTTRTPDEHAVVQG